MPGLYDPGFEHDGCGVALVARLDAVPTHETVARGLEALSRMEHRGAEGADADSGDGAGITIQIPDAFFRAELSDLPPAGRYGVAMVFLPQEEDARATQERLLVDAVTRHGQHVLDWRDVPVRPEQVGRVARDAAPVIRQLFIGASADVRSTEALERRLYVIRRSAEIASGEQLVVPSCSARTVVYKGMLSAPQLSRFYPDLVDGRVASALALVHSRFSTNTFPSWELAHPYRLLAHNGEVNTLTGNVNWMRARESQLSGGLLGDDLVDILPAIRPGGSDSASLDNVLELLVRGGRSLPHAMMMMVPAAHEGADDLADPVSGFYRYHSCLMEPWDGPACVSFTDGRVIGATLDRNGLRPGRYVITTDGWVLLASEAGTLRLDDATIARRGRLRPGRLFLVDLERRRVLADGEAEAEVAAARPYGRWFDREIVRLAHLPPSLPSGDPLKSPDGNADPVRTGQLAFGWSEEDLRVLVAPLAAKGKEPDGSMGTDVPLAVLSDQAPPLFDYFKQRFAQVTNPAIDPVRESIVMSLQSMVGPQGDLLSENPGHARRLLLAHPVLRDGHLATIRSAERHLRGSSSQRLQTETIDCTWPAADGASGLPAALDRICADVDAGIACGTAIAVLSDRRTSAERVPIPSLLAVGAVHHHLVRTGRRLRVGLVVESGEPRAVHHVAALLGFGASAVNPYLLFASLPRLVASGDLPADSDLRAVANAVVKGLTTGLLKVMSKMGISTLASYTGAQVFEAVGLDRELVDEHFTGTSSRLGGVGLDALAEEAVGRHARAFPAASHQRLPTGGVYAWRREGERHMWNPRTVPLLQEAVAGDDGAAAYVRFAETMNADATRRATLRGLLRLVDADVPLDVDDVEPASAIVTRFSTGAMSLGSISSEVHETLAVAMNRLGGKSNTGEGGEDPARFGDDRRSAIKQVASARFGVTIDYLVNADQLQIKIAQGSKPGEGGQLPGHKVSEEIAAQRHSTPGVELISPPPHHDIYSIEDLKQLIYDLRCANPQASVSVKLVAEAGVGTVAAGVAKAGADSVTISGHDGGTGSSPLSSISSAGVPWELGIAETQQTLVHHGLRSRISVQADGQLKTGLDVVVAGLLGAEEMGFSTAPLIASGCIMMRVCHLNTCPVGIATQDPELRRRFTGTPEHVIRYFFHVAEEVRTLMARLGVRRFDELVGRTDLLAPADVDHWKGHALDVRALLEPPAAPADAPRHKVHPARSVLDDAFDHDLVAACAPAIERREPVVLERRVRNTERTVGGMLSSAIARAHGSAGLDPGTIRLLLRGSAGQSAGAWLARGVELTLVGEANDYVGKGLSGGVVAVRPPDEAPFRAEDNVLVGNTVLYGATSGRAFFRGQAGERFAVRNSGASAVVEGVGDHACEYMTGGRVVVLGPTGRNVAAGMSGGILYVHDPDGRLPGRCNHELVELDVLGDDDWRTVADLLAEHRHRTGSTVAAALLDRPRWARSAFAKVIPTAYRAALEALRAQASGLEGPALDDAEAVATSMADA